MLFYPYHIQWPSISGLSSGHPEGQDFVVVNTDLYVQLRLRAGRCALGLLLWCSQLQFVIYF